MANAKKKSQKKLKTSMLRALTATAVFAVVAIGLAFATGTGTLSSLGWNSVAAICPLGALESLLGAKAIAVRCDHLRFGGKGLLLLGLPGTSFPKPL